MTKNELQIRFSNIVKEINDLSAKSKSLCDEFLRHRKFQDGQKVSITHWNGKLVSGIIARGVVGTRYGTSELEIKYRVSKIKKDGTAHATAYLGFDWIKEKDVIEA